MRLNQKPTGDHRYQKAEEMASRPALQRDQQGDARTAASRDTTFLENFPVARREPARGDRPLTC
jgi:hypothetical protein